MAAEKDMDFFKQNSVNKNTAESTSKWYRNYARWAEKSGKRKDIENIEKHKLNSILEFYFAENVRLDGKQYEPSSLSNMQAALDRYLKEKGCTFSIIKDREFTGSQNVLEGRAKYLRDELGMGRKPNAADSFSPQE